MPDLPRRSRWPLLLLAAAGLGVVVWSHRAGRESVVQARKPAGESAREVAWLTPKPTVVALAPAATSVKKSEGAETGFKRGELFKIVEPAGEEIARIEATLPAPSRAVRYVQVDTAWVTGKSSPFWRQPGEGRVALPLADGRTLTVVIDGSEMLGADRFTSTGHLEGRPESRAVFAWCGGFLHATMDDAEIGSYVLRVATAGVSQFYAVDPALVPSCGGERRKVVDDVVRTAAAARLTRARAGAQAPTASATAVRAPAQASAAAVGNPQAAEVHVMMAATQDVLSTLTGAERTAALQSAFDAAIARTNGDLAASQISARVRLVRVAETNYDESKSAANKVQDDALTALQSDSDGLMDELHALRDQSGADIVCLVLNRADLASSGLAYVIDSPGDTTNALFAFSVVQYAFVAGSSVVSHELGHSFGCAHDRENAFTPGAYSYSYGYRFLGADGVRYRDIMAYPPGVQLGYFSNPRITAPAPVSAALGIPAGRPGESDTARTIEEAAFEVSGYRLQTQTPPSAGRLINVSTLATVGPGDRAAVAGVVIGPGAPRRVLLRAVGPGLTAFGVSNLLARPSLEVYHGHTLLERNAGWSADALNTQRVSEATAALAIFPLATGSTDAALSPDLSPGAYTAVVSSPAVMGRVLIEAYEYPTSPDSGVFQNVSTRAYADHAGSPLIAGFVVTPGPGPTKRVLIRALGPSLARAPLNVAGVMNDPRMEIRNAAGDLILVGDDWSTGAEGGASAANDFKPTVRFYNERQIAATGFAPPNRREPALLVDLPPGNYTVTVVPFELLPDEPAQPGVALVEVYEIDR